MPNLTPDCGSCAALCCAVFAFDQSESFAIDKEAGEVCPNLNAANGCSIFSKRTDLGFRGCISYTCYGAGQVVTQDVFEGRSWRDEPELMHRMGAALSVLRRIHEQHVLLTAARNLPLTGKQSVELNDLELLLEPKFPWTEASLKAFPLEAVSMEIRTWLQQLKRLVY